MQGFSAKDIDSFELELSKLNIKVPARGEGRKTEHCEQYQIYHPLKGLFEAGKIEYPASLVKRERPDFVLMLGQNIWGIETTEVVHPDWARASTLPESQNDDSVLDPSLFKWGTKNRSLTKLREIASKEKLTGTGWAGDSVEIEFAQSIYDTVCAKHLKLIEGYERFQKDCLLIYHNLSSPILDFDRGAELASEALNGYWQEQAFSIVVVHKNNSIGCYT